MKSRALVFFTKRVARSAIRGKRTLGLALKQVSSHCRTQFPLTRIYPENIPRLPLSSTTSPRDSNTLSSSPCVVIYIPAFRSQSHIPSSLTTVELFVLRPSFANMGVLRTFLASAVCIAAVTAQNARIAFTSTPAVAVAGSTYNLTWAGGDGTTVRGYRSC